LDESVYGARGVAAVAGQVPLVVVPVIGKAEARKSRRWLWIALAVVAGILSIVVAMLAYHFFVTPLDVWWFSKLRQLGLG
jgi:heme/copper-type cytochrome/quinol oxidase subunit 2